MPRRKASDTIVISDTGEIVQTPAQTEPAKDEIGLTSEPVDTISDDGIVAYIRERIIGSVIGITPSTYVRYNDKGDTAEFPTDLSRVRSAIDYYYANAMNPTPYGFVTMFKKVFGNYEIQSPWFVDLTKRE